MNQIEDMLRYDGWFVERNNTGAMKKTYRDKNGKTKDRFIRFNTKGKPDLSALKNGRYVCIEVKTPRTRNTATRWQLDYISEVERHGGIGMVAWSLEMVATRLGIRMLL